MTEIKRTYKEVLAGVETHVEYINNHLRNIDSHLNNLNNHVAENTKCGVRNKERIKAIYLREIGLYALITAVLLKLLGVY